MESQEAESQEAPSKDDLEVCMSALLYKKQKCEPRRFFDIYKNVDVFLGKGSFGSVHIYQNRESGENMAVKKVLECVAKKREKVMKEILVSCLLILV